MNTDLIHLVKHQQKAFIYKNLIIMTEFVISYSIYGGKVFSILLAILQSDLPIL